MNAEAGYHYNVMRRAIQAIDAADEVISLERLASDLSMSPAHFQRVFSRWVGVSPKRYQQYLTLDHARSLLANRFTTLETAGELGLSGTSRLHDLFVKWQAMSPGEYARKGAGLTIDYGWFDSPFGRVLAMGTNVGICGLAFAQETGDAAAFADMTARWPEARLTEAPDAIEPWVVSAFGGRGDTRLHLMGAPFQIKVWEALLRIPPGHLATYQDIAKGIGKPSAARASSACTSRGHLFPRKKWVRKIQNMFATPPQRNGGRF